MRENDKSNIPMTSVFMGFKGPSAGNIYYIGIGHLYWGIAHMPSKRRPVKKLILNRVTGSGKAEVVEKPSQLAHIMWVASRGELGYRNVSVLWCLFGTGMRVNETAKLKVRDVYHKDGELKTAFVISGSYTKTGKPRTAYIIVRAQREALERLREQRIKDAGYLSTDGSYGGLAGDSPLFLSRHGKKWTRLAFNEKKYKSKEGEVKTTLVCSSLENLIRKILKSAGLVHGSSHSGRRTLATWMDRKGHDLDLIQRILGHEDSEMTLEYIDPWKDRIHEALDKTYNNIKMPNYETATGGG